MNWSDRRRVFCWKVLGGRPVTTDVTRLDQTYQEDRLILALVLIIVSALAIGWIAGEATDRRGIRLVCGPLFTIAIASIAAGAAALHTSFDSSTRYSGATKNFVSALVAAIDRGDAALAHDELQRFNGISSETYEGGMFLKWLNESASRLNSPAQGAEPVEATRVDASYCQELCFEDGLSGDLLDSIDELLSLEKEGDLLVTVETTPTLLS